jgi:hypothetical protein
LFIYYDNKNGYYIYASMSIILLTIVKLVYIEINYHLMFSTTYRGRTPGCYQNRIGKNRLPDDHI